MIKHKTEMMEEIKLRCWSPDNKEMYYPDEHYSFRIHNTSISYQPHYESEDLASFCTDPSDWEKKIEVMQYTGLKDKNGKEIYSMDIMKSGRTDILYVIEYQKKFARFVGLNLLRNISFTAGDFFGGEVIGNVFENPELLKP